MPTYLCKCKCHSLSHPWPSHAHSTSCTWQQGRRCRPSCILPLTQTDWQAACQSHDRPRPTWSAHMCGCCCWRSSGGKQQGRDRCLLLAGSNAHLFRLELDRDRAVMWYIITWETCCNWHHVVRNNKPCDLVYRLFSILFLGVNIPFFLNMYSIKDRLFPKMVNLAAYYKFLFQTDLSKNVHYI